MTIRERFKAEFLRALRNFRYERTDTGVLFPDQKMSFGGVFRTSVDGSAWSPEWHNTVALENLDAMLSCYFDNGAAAIPTGFFVAPFTNNVAPTSALTAATFTATQGEWTGYTQATRVQWVPNGASSGQTVSNSVAPATFTVGATAATVYGAAVIATVSAKSATTGTLVGAALFGAANTLNAGSTLQVQYSLSATAS